MSHPDDHAIPADWSVVHADSQVDPVQGQVARADEGSPPPEDEFTLSDEPLGVDLPTPEVTRRFVGLRLSDTTIPSGTTPGTGDDQSTLSYEYPWAQPEPSPLPQAYLDAPEGAQFGPVGGSLGEPTTPGGTYVIDLREPALPPQAAPDGAGSLDELGVSPLDGDARAITDPTLPPGQRHSTPSETGHVQQSRKTPSRSSSGVTSVVSRHQEVVVYPPPGDLEVEISGKAAELHQLMDHSYTRVEGKEYFFHDANGLLCLSVDGVTFVVQPGTEEMARYEAGLVAAGGPVPQVTPPMPGHVQVPVALGARTAADTGVEMGDLGDSSSDDEPSPRYKLLMRSIRKRLADDPPRLVQPVIPRAGSDRTSRAVTVTPPTVRRVSEPPQGPPSKRRASEGQRTPGAPYTALEWTPGEQEHVEAREMRPRNLAEDFLRSTGTAGRAGSVPPPSAPGTNREHVDMSLTLQPAGRGRTAPRSASVVHEGERQMVWDQDARVG